MCPSREKCNLIMRKTAVKEASNQNLLEDETDLADIVPFQQYAYVYALQHHFIKVCRDKKFGELYYDHVENS